MRKIFKQELAGLKDNLAVQEIRDILTRDFVFPKQSLIQRMVFKIWWLIFAFILIPIGVALPIIGYEQGNITTAEIVLTIVLIYLAFFLMYVTYYQKKKYAKTITKALFKHRDNVYKIWFEKNYSDAKLLGKVEGSDMSVMAAKNRGSIIPNDAEILGYFPFYKLEGTNGAKIDIALVDWKWTDPNPFKPNNKHTQKLAYISIDGIKDTFKNFEFTMFANRVFEKNEAVLENEKFIKEWTCHFDDQVKLRMLLTPSVQEDVLNTIKDLSFEMSMVDGRFWASVAVPINIDIFNMKRLGVKMLSDKEAVINKATNDFIFEIETYQRWISYAAVFRTLFKTN